MKHLITWIGLSVFLLFGGISSCCYQNPDKIVTYTNTKKDEGKINELVTVQLKNERRDVDESKPWEHQFYITYRQAVLDEHFSNVKILPRELSGEFL